MQDSTHHQNRQRTTLIPAELHVQPEPRTSYAHGSVSATAGTRTRTVGDALQPLLPRSFRGWGAVSDSSTTGTDEPAYDVREGTTDDAQADHTQEASNTITDILAKAAQAAAQMPARSRTAGIGVPMARHSASGRDFHHPRNLGHFSTARAQLHLHSSITSGTTSQGEVDAV